MVLKTTNMITEDYVSYEVAKLLKEKGFNEDCKAYYEDGKFCWVWNDGCSRNTDNPKYVSCPTHQMAMKWLREKGIFIWIGQCSMITKDPATQEYHPVVINNNDYIMEEYLGYFIGYSNAVEAALKYCLTKLI